MFYVYELIDPRTDRPFYIGKGKGRRMHQHAKDARNGKPGRKCDFIRELHAVGLCPTERIVKRFEDEAAAYAYEAELIAELRDDLLNIAAGGHGGRGVVDPERDARKLVLRFGALMRQAIDLFRSGTRVCVNDFDFVKASHDLAMRTRERAGPEFFDKHVWSV